MDVTYTDDVDESEPGFGHNQGVLARCSRSPMEFLVGPGIAFSRHTRTDRQT